MQATADRALHAQSLAGLAKSRSCITSIAADQSMTNGVQPYSLLLLLLLLVLLLLLLTRPAAATKTGNPKSQYRNPKQIRNPQFEIQNLCCRQNGRGRAPSRFSPAACHCVLRFPFLPSSLPPFLPSSLLPFFPSSLPPFLPLFCASNFGFCSKHARTVRASYTRKLYSYSYSYSPALPASSRAVDSGRWAEI